jgi:hypothetical protein
MLESSCCKNQKVFQLIWSRQLNQS